MGMHKNIFFEHYVYLSVELLIDQFIFCSEY